MGIWGEALGVLGLPGGLGGGSQEVLEGLWGFVEGVGRGLGVSLARKPGPLRVWGSPWGFWGPLGGSPRGVWGSLEVFGGSLGDFLGGLFPDAGVPGGLGAPRGIWGVSKGFLGGQKGFLGVPGGLGGVPFPDARVFGGFGGSPWGSWGDSWWFLGVPQGFLGEHCGFWGPPVVLGVPEGVPCFFGGGVPSGLGGP